MDKCKECGVKFVKIHHKQKYCTKECRSKHNVKSLRTKRKNYKKIKKCEYCCTEFMPNYRNKKYCNPNCKENAKRYYTASYRAKKGIPPRIESQNQIKEDIVNISKDIDKESACTVECLLKEFGDLE